MALSKNDYSKLSKKLIELDLKSERKTILIVPYALLDLIDFNEFQLEEYNYNGDWRYEREKKRDGKKRIT